MNPLATALRKAGLAPPLPPDPGLGAGDLLELRGVGFVLEDPITVAKTTAALARGTGLWVRILQEDLSAVHPVTAGQTYAKIIRGLIPAGHPGVMLSFDVPRDGPEVYEIGSCRQFAYGFVAEGGLALLEPNGPVVTLITPMGTIEVSLFEGMAHLAKGECVRLRPLPPPLPRPSWEDR